MTTKSTVRNIKSRFSSGNSVQNMTTAENDIKTSRITVKKPFSTTLLQSNSSTNGLSNHLKKRTLQINNFLHSKLKSNNSNEAHCNHQSNERSKSPPHVFHAIAPVPPEKITKSLNTVNNDRKSNNEPTSPSDSLFNHVLRHTVIKTMSTDSHSSIGQSSHSDEDDYQSKFHPVLSSIDADIDQSDESNDDSNKKARRLQRTHRTSISSVQQKKENNNCKNEQRSSSDENKIMDSKITVNGYSERRSKPTLVKKHDHPLHATPLTPTHGDNKKSYHYHALDNLESDMKVKHESNRSSIPTMTVSANAPSVKKINRFQVKSIRKSQQSQILLAHRAMAVSSHDEDYSASNEKTHSSLDAPNCGKQCAQTLNADVENSMTNTNHMANGGISTFVSVENEDRRVHFQASVIGKQESTGDEEKSRNHVTATVTLPTAGPTTHSSANSAQGDVCIDTRFPCETSSLRQTKETEKLYGIY